MVTLVVPVACGGGDEPAARRPAATAAASTSTTVAVDPAVFLDEVATLVRDEAFYADRIDWDAWEASLPEVVAAADRPSDTYDVVDELLADLDRHSSFLPVASGPEDVAGNERQELPTAEVEGGIGRLTVPLALRDPAEDGGAEYVAAAWEALDRPACGWVLDLRANGGNAWTIAMSLAPPLLGAGPAFGYRFRDGTTAMVTIGDDGSLDGGGRPPVDVPEPLATPPDRAGTPVAIVQSFTTASAHEFAVLAFAGRDATRTFGTPTSGLPTAVDGFPLTNGSLLLLTTGLGVDRTGAVHESAIPPVEQVAGTGLRPPERGATDPALDAAHAWLATQPPCAPGDRPD